MKIVRSFVLAGLACLTCVSASMAQAPFDFYTPLFDPSLNTVQPAPAPKSLTNDELGTLLSDLGYTTERVTFSTGEACYKLLLPGRETEQHVIAIDPSVKVVFIAGTVSQSPFNASAAPADVLSRMLTANFNVAPSFMFVNANQAVGLITPRGNSEVTGENLKAQIEHHLSNVDNVLAPFIRELEGQGQNSFATY